MSDMNLKEITQCLEEQFQGDERKLIFWFDEKQDFAEDVKELRLKNAKVYFLTQGNQVATKHLLERQDVSGNYLLYAPFKQPEAKGYHLEDMLLYSKIFHADKLNMFMHELKIPDDFKELTDKYRYALRTKDLRHRFSEYQIEEFTKDRLILGFLCAMAKQKLCSLDALVLHILDNGLEDNPVIEEFSKCGLDVEFWNLVRQEYGYSEQTSNLKGFVMTILITGFKGQLAFGLPEHWSHYVGKPAAVGLLDSMMNNNNYQEKYKEFASLVAVELRLKIFLEGVSVVDLLECDVFEEVDSFIIRWLKERLLAEEFNAKLGDLSLSDICDKRVKTYFARKYTLKYRMLRAASKLVSAAHYDCPSTFGDLVKQYVKSDYLYDWAYREFYICYNHLDDVSEFVELRQLVENIYTNEYLGKLLPAWNSHVVSRVFWQTCPLQRDFYKNNIEPLKEKTVVIISDALRYEVGMEIFKVMQNDRNCVMEQAGYMLSVLPSITSYGMAALLPHREISVNEKGNVLVDDFYPSGTNERLFVLRQADERNTAVTFDALNKADREKLREQLTGKRVIYVYHNQIDSRGEAPATENEIFDACAEAVQEIVGLIKKISGSGNTYHFIVTADHGFIYKCDKLRETDKITVPAKGNTLLDERRCLVTDLPIHDDGVVSVSLGTSLGTDNGRWVSVPVSSNVFKSHGGTNYVHGGSSPQEMLVPMLEFKMEKGHVASHKVDIEPISFISKITNLKVNVDFLQKEIVSDVAKKARYGVYFEAKGMGKISNEGLINADSVEEDVSKRITKVRFTLTYKKAPEYSMVVEDKETGTKVREFSVVLDLPYTDDYGF